MSNINVSINFRNICRTCLNNCDVKFFRDEKISDVIYKLTDFHFETNDDLPQQICQKCFEKINEIYEFMLQCKQTHSSLIYYLDHFKNKQTKQEQDITEETDETVNIKDEDITIEEHKIEFVEVKIKPEYPENININLTEEDLPKQSDNIMNKNKEEINIPINLIKLHVSNITNHVKKQYTCDVCNKTFNYLSTFKRHKSLHNVERPHKCDQCSKTFNQSNHLKVHMRTHSGERPYKCEQCFKTFTLSNHLKDHMRTHNGERPYKCDQCPKRFAQSNHVKQHMLTHTGERPFKCDQCDKSFTRYDILLSHTRLHSGERPYKCEHCPKTFNQSNHYKAHMRIHDNGVSYCDFMGNDLNI